jgi:hypothetical protein
MSETSYEKFKREHPDLLAAAEAELEVTEEIARLQALVASYREAARSLAAGQRDEGFSVDLRQDFGIDDPDLIDCPKCGGDGMTRLSWGTTGCGCPDCHGTGRKPSLDGERRGALTTDEIEREMLEEMGLPESGVTFYLSTTGTKCPTCGR